MCSSVPRDAVQADRAGGRRGGGQHHQDQLHHDDRVDIRLAEPGIILQRDHRAAFEERVPRRRDRPHGDQECRHPEGTQPVILPAARGRQALVGEHRSRSEASWTSSPPGSCGMTRSSYNCPVTVNRRPGRGRTKPRSESVGIVGEVGRQPALDLGERHPLAGGVALDLVAGDQVDGEVAGLGMGEVEPADRGAGCMA